MGKLLGPESCGWHQVEGLRLVSVVNSSVDSGDPGIPDDLGPQCHRPKKRHYIIFVRMSASFAKSGLLCQNSSAFESQCQSGSPKVARPVEHHAHAAKALMIELLVIRT
jgi:hypothetical protein